MSTKETTKPYLIVRMRRLAWSYAGLELGWSGATLAWSYACRLWDKTSVRTYAAQVSYKINKYFKNMALCRI